MKGSSFFVVATITSPTVAWPSLATQVPPRMAHCTFGLIHSRRAVIVRASGNCRCGAIRQTWMGFRRKQSTSPTSSLVLWLRENSWREHTRTGQLDFDPRLSCKTSAIYTEFYTLPRSEKFVNKTSYKQWAVHTLQFVP